MDEFSDFQMAVQKPAPARISVGLSPRIKGPSVKGPSVGLRFPDSSPVHSLTGHSKSDLVRSQQHVPTTLSSPLKPVVPPPASQKFGTNVGSRLANYDLGLSVPTMQNNGFQGCSMELSSSNPPKTISNQPTIRTTQDLLIGEEDRYSALRMLIETDINSTVSVFEKSADDPVPALTEAQEVGAPAQPSNSAMYPANSVAPPSKISSPPRDTSSYPITYNSGPAVNANVMSALEFSTTSGESPSTGGDSSSDFGDFQSFTGFASAPEMNNHQPCNLNSSSPSHQHSNHVVINSIMGGFQQHSSLPDPPKLDFITTTVDNGICDSDADAEFGDFVSVEPVVSKNTAIQSPPTSVPAVNSWNNTLDLSALTMTPSLPKDLRREEPTSSKFCSPSQPAQHSVANGGFDNFSNPAVMTHNKKNSVDQGNNGLDWLETAQDLSSKHVFGANDLRKTAQSPANPSSISTPSFIRTSLIRNDEVTDIDPVKWNQSVEDGNNDCPLEYNSFERKDFSGGKSKFLDVSPETRSIASLDLGSYVTIDYGETNGVNINNNNNNNNNNKAFVDQSMTIQKHKNEGKSEPTAAPGPMHNGLGTSAEHIIYDEYDKYQCFREESENEKERYATEWNRCLQSCKQMVSNAFSVLSGVSASEVIREVVADEKGYFYVLNILEIYRISQRIQKSAERVGVDSKLENVFLEINSLWETLSAFLLGTCVSSEICQQTSEDDEDCKSHNLLPSCGVCLCSVDTSQFVDYGSKTYHCQCANFWVNQVDTILPSLSFVPGGNNGGTSGNSNNNGYNQKFDKGISLV